MFAVHIASGFPVINSSNDAIVERPYSIRDVLRQIDSPLTGWLHDPC